MTPLAIHTALRNALAAAFPTMPIAWPNEDFTPPEEAAWIRATIKYGQDFPGSFSGDDKEVGVYIVQVFTPNNSGAGDCLDLAGQVKAAFAWKSFSGVECQVAPLADPKEDAGGGPWFQCNVNVSWWAWV